jgi:hypothetical protein
VLVRLTVGFLNFIVSLFFMTSVKKLASGVTKKSTFVTGRGTTPVLIAVVLTLLVCIGVVWFQGSLQRRKDDVLNIDQNKLFSERVCSRAVPNQTGFVITQPKTRIIENLTIVGTPRDTDDKLIKGCLLRVTWDELTNAGREERRGEVFFFFVTSGNNSIQFAQTTLLLTQLTEDIYYPSISSPVFEEKSKDPWVVNAANLIYLVQ